MQRLQVVFVADGDFQEHMCALIGRLRATDRAAVCDFDARRYRLQPAHPIPDITGAKNHDREPGEV